MLLSENKNLHSLAKLLVVMQFPTIRCTHGKIWKREVINHEKGASPLLFLQVSVVMEALVFSVAVVEGVQCPDPSRMSEKRQDPWHPFCWQQLPDFHNRGCIGLKPAVMKTDS